MDKAQIIEDIARRKVVEQLIRNITHRHDATMDDLAQIVYEALLNTEEERIIEIWEQGDTSVNCYCCAIIRNQYYSDSSRFYYDGPDAGSEQEHAPQEHRTDTRNYTT